MKKVLLFPLFFLALGAATVSAQVEDVIQADNNIGATTEVAENLATTTEQNILTGTSTTDVLDESSATSSTTTLDLATTTPALPVVTKENPLVTDTISIIPGSISLKLTTTEPAVASRVKAAQSGVVRVETSDGLFNLIYTGFEEFVFRVFGI